MDTPDMQRDRAEAGESPELRYAQEFAALSEELSRKEREQPTLDGIVALAVETIDSCDYCGVSVRQRDGKLTTPAGTGPIVVEADRLQDELGEGPCVDTLWLDTYVVPDLEHETRWPRWATRAAELGIRSALSLRLDTPDDRQATASLNLYAIAPEAFDNTDLAIASIFARHAGTALSGARTRDELRTAMRSRQVIGVAQGILIQRFGLTLDQSFEVLRRFSQNHNIKLRVLAEELVRSGGIPELSGDSTTVNSALEVSFGIRYDAAEEPGPDPSLEAPSQT